jgi:hypothetical protein
MNNQKTQYQTYLPRFVPKGDKPRIDWGRQLTTEYQAKYKGAYPVIDDPDELDAFLADLLTDLDLADELLLVVRNDEDLYHGNINLKNHFLYGRNGDPQITITHATPPLESGASKLKPGLLERLLWLARRIIELKAPENVLKALEIFDPGPIHPDLHLQIFVIDGDRLIDGRPAVTWTKGVNDAAVFEYRESDAAAELHWHPAGTFISSPALPAIPATAAPRVVHLRGRYLKGNQQVGQWSAPYNLPIPAATDESL